MAENEKMADGRPGTWENRRRVIFLSLLYCAGVISYITGWGEDTTLNKAIIESAFLLAGMIIGAYVFGAVWDDKE